MYKALYRKYRPMDFDSVIGQNDIVKILRNSVVNNIFGHAYLFLGSRGTGKTSVSKIFARAINCLDNKNGNPCGKCDNCLNSFDNECIDIIEIDAASNNGVDEIRELKSKVNLVPSNLKYKVYIIDEVHMLSIGAFNALLKTLEEPPSHVIFILATTDAHKIPETIISRCQVLSFNRISNEGIVSNLKSICEKEKINIQDDVIVEIANLVDGGMRDALGILDKLKSYTDDEITLDVLAKVNGILSKNEIIKFTDYIFSNNLEKIIASLYNYNLLGKDLVQIMYQLINYLKKIVVESIIKNTKTDYSIDDIITFLDLINKRMFDIKKSDNVLSYLEIVFIKYLHDKTNFNLKSSNNTSNISETKVVNKKADNINSGVDKNTIEKKDLNKLPININRIMDVRINNILAKASIDEKKYDLSVFEKIKNLCNDQKNGFYATLFLDSNLCCSSSDGFIVSYSEGLIDKILVNKNNLEDLYYSVSNKRKKIAVLSNEKWEDEKAKYIKNRNNKISYKLLDEEEEKFEESKKNDIIVDSAVELFGSDIVVEEE